MYELYSRNGHSSSSDNQDVLIKVQGVSKKFCRSLKRSLWYGVQDVAGDLNPFRVSKPKHSELRPDEFWAVNDVLFKVRRGECLGLIGRNGAGKTTLLKMLNGLIKPDKGRIEMRGRVGGLIALGAGFNPVLTGRENVYVNGSILGFTRKEIDAKFDEIVEFAELAEFIDTPAQSYSSGMQVRLGFSVAAVLIQPDVLLLDEVLAVGDIGFTIKCLNAVRTLAQECAVVFVSHNMQLISSFCHRVLVMAQGNILIDAQNPAEGMDAYLSLFPIEASVSGTGQAVVESVKLVVTAPRSSDSGQVQLVQGQPFSLEVDITIKAEISAAEVNVYVMDGAMTPIICHPVNDKTESKLVLGPGNHHLRLSVGNVDLNAGMYSFTIVVSSTRNNMALARLQGAAPFRVYACKSSWGSVVRPVCALTAD